MTGLDIAAFVLIGLMAAMGIAVFVFLGGMPGKVAGKRAHPYADAVRVGGWVTLVFGGVGWPFVLIWAYATPDDGTRGTDPDGLVQGQEG